MFFISNVIKLSGLTEEQCIEIMEKYSELKEKYMPEEK